MNDFSAYGRASARVYSWLIDPLLSSLRREITTTCVAHGITDVIDIACATGEQCRDLQRAGIAATGIDLSEAMIERARKIGPAEIRYVQGSALSLPFPTESFTGAILSLCLHEHPAHEQERMIAEAVRVVRPGGAVIAAEYSPPGRINRTWVLIHVIERLAGREHFHNFRKFVRAGGIESIVRYLPPVTEQRSLFQRTVKIIVAKKG